MPAEEAQEAFDAVEAQYYDRVDGPANQVGFVAQQVEASGALGKSLCKLKKFEGAHDAGLRCSGRSARACSRG